jgi:hypothetical protein
MLRDLSISFPSEVSRLERQVEIERGWTATQRIAAVVESLKAVRALAAAGGRSAGQLEYHERCERQWQQRIKEFIAEHAGTTTNRG